MMDTLTRSYKTARAALLAALCPGLVLACGRDSAGPSAPTTDPVQTTTVAEQMATDWGEDWADTGGGVQGPSSAAGGRSMVWSIVLATFPADANPQAAANTAQQIRTYTSQLGDVWVHRSEEGSMVLFGRYDSPQAEQAQADLQMIKETTVRDQPAFAQAMLTRINLGSRLGQLHPYALMSARQRYPNVDPLYTLEVAVWGDFESGELTLEEIHERAEEHANKLRLQGYDAYYYHDDDKRLSMVTVGLFNHTAIDTRSGLYSPAVGGLLQRFPAHLVNGETLREPIDGRNAARGTRIQKPMLVHVPKW